MNVDLIFDPVCPWCYIGVRRLQRVLKSVSAADLELHFRAYQVNPDISDSGVSRQDFLRHKFGGTKAANYLFDAARRAGAKENIDFQFHRITMTPCTIDAHRLVRWTENLGGSPMKVVGALFSRYFTSGENIGRHDVLIDIARAQELDWRTAADWLNSGMDRDLVMAESRMARQMGVRGVPFFIFNHCFSITGVEDVQVFHNAISVAMRASKASHSTSFKF